MAALDLPDDSLRCPLPLFQLPKPSSAFPYNVSAWAQLLKSCPSMDKNWFLLGLEYGFDIGCYPKKLVSCKRNMPSAFAHSEIIDNYLKEEISLRSIAGPFKSPPFPNLHINRFGVIPKSTLGKWRLITDLSYPFVATVNDGVPSDLCHVTCKGIQSATDKAMRHGKGALMFWKEKYYVDLALPFGLSRAPNIFNRGADLLEWAFSDSDLVCEDDIQHYYDDFFNVGPPGSDQCQVTQETYLAVCDYLGVPVEHSETIGATTCLKYLGFILDSEQLEIRLPKEKQDKVLRALTVW